MQLYALFLTAFFVLASGITLLQVAANPYVSLLGPPRLASSRLNLAQALNSLGTTLAPKFGGLLILSGAVLGATELAKLAPAAQDAYRLQQAQMVQWPYIGIAVLLFALAVVVWLFHLPHLQERRRGRRAAPLRRRVEASPRVARHGGHLRLRRRGSVDRQFHDQLPLAAADRRHAAGARGRLRFAVLGRRDDRALRRFGAADAHRHPQAARV